MHVRPLNTLTVAEIRELGRQAAENGERIEDVNPFTPGSHSYRHFASAFHERAADLQPAG